VQVMLLHSIDLDFVFNHTMISKFFHIMNSNVCVSGFGSFRYNILKMKIVNTSLSLSQQIWNVKTRRERNSVIHLGLVFCFHCWLDDQNH